MKKKIIVLLIILANLYSFTLSQEIKFPKDSVFNNVKVTTKNWDEVISSELIFNYNQKSFVILNKNNQSLNYKLYNIYSIEQQKGSRALEGGLIGGAIGMLIGTLCTDDISSSVFFLCIGGGLGIGILIGRGNKKYKKIYYNEQFVIE